MSATVDLGLPVSTLLHPIVSKAAIKRGHQWPEDKKANKKPGAVISGDVRALEATQVRSKRHDPECCVYV